MSSIQTPFKMKTQLAGNPQQGPKYGITIERPEGRKVVCADPTATRAMVALMDMQAQMNGAASHWGGPSAFAELMSSLFALMIDMSQEKKCQWHEAFHFINDAGHCENGLYALRANYGWAGVELATLKKFRSIDGFLTGHGEAHLFPEGVAISNGPLGSGLPQAQGLALADSLAKRDRVTVCAISDGGCMEGEAREALAAIPGMAERGRMAPFVMIISDNNTKLSGRIDQDAYSMNPTFRSLGDLGWNLIQLADGHSLEGCLVTIENAIRMAIKNPRQPVAIHARTIKGFGVEKTEKSASGGHGFPLKEPQELEGFLKEIYKGQPVPSEFTSWQTELIEIERERKSRPKVATSPSEKVQVGVAKALIAKKESGLPIISVSSDLPGSTGLADFQKKFPDCTIDVGVAESNMMSAAIGLSKEGFIPVVDTFSQFAVTKGNLPLIMAALSQGPMIGIFSHVGFQDAADGASHQALSYFATTNALVNTETFALTSSLEAEALIGQALDQFAMDRAGGNVPKTRLFFLGRENFSLSYLPSGYKFQLGRAQVVADHDRSNVTIIAAGALLEEALKAERLLHRKGIFATVVNPSAISRPDVQTIGACVKKSQGYVLTVEDHQIHGGMGANILQSLLANRVTIQRADSLGVDDHFGQSAYSALDLYRKHKLDSESIARAVENLLK